MECFITFCGSVPVSRWCECFDVLKGQSRWACAVVDPGGQVVVDVNATDDFVALVARRGLYV